MASLADQAIRWQEDRLVLLDQRALPNKVLYVECTQASEVVAAIRDMVVRGAPAIGVSAAYAVVLAAREQYAVAPEDWIRRMDTDLQSLAQVTS